MQAKLWTRNFIFAVAGMVISAAGGVGLSVALGIIVFQETQSTMLSAIFTALSLIPQLVLPLIIGPFIDRRNPLKVMLTNEIILALLFFATGLITYLFDFSYGLYLVFAFLISCFGVISELSSSSITPQIIARENYVRGNAILSTIYPLCNVVVAPIAVLVYGKYGITVILLAYGVACLLDVLLESRIKADFVYIEAEKTSLREYAADLKAALRYFKDDRAIRSVFLTFTLSMCAGASYILVYPFFNQSAVLTDSHYSIMISINSAGYLIGGLLHYFIRIPDNKRYRMAVTVYFVFVTCESFFFLMPFWLMCGSKFMLGVLGMNSANIRISAVQARVPDLLRAKVNSLFTVMISASQLLGQLAVGALGEFLPYWTIQMGFQWFYLFGILFFILPRKNKVRELYNYSTAQT